MLSSSSWDTTQARMAGLIADVMGTRTGATNPALQVAAE
jgi:UDP-galactopyranose mutase